MIPYGKRHSVCIGVNLSCMALTLLTTLYTISIGLLYDEVRPRREIESYHPSSVFN